MTPWIFINLAFSFVLVFWGEPVWAATEGLPQFNPEDFPTQLFWLAITFALLYLVISRRALPSLSRALEQRESRITGDLAKAEDFQRQAETLEEQNQRILSQARERARHMSQETLDRIEAMRLQRLKSLDQEISDRVSSVEARIDQERERALATIDQSAETIATAILTKLVSHPPSSPQIVQAIAAIHKSDP